MGTEREANETTIGDEDVSQTDAASVSKMYPNVVLFL